MRLEDRLVLAIAVLGTVIALIMGMRENARDWRASRDRQQSQQLGVPWQPDPAALPINRCNDHEHERVEWRHVSSGQILAWYELTEQRALLDWLPPSGWDRLDIHFCRQALRTLPKSQLASLLLVADHRSWRAQSGSRTGNNNHRLHPGLVDASTGEYLGRPFLIDLQP